VVECPALGRSIIEASVKRGLVDVLCDCNCDFVWELYVGMFVVMIV